MFRYHILFLIFLCTKVAFAQIELKGTVLDSSTSEPLENVYVLVDESTTFITSANGSFHFKNLTKGNKIVYFSHVGCDSKLISLNLKVDTTITVYLAHHVHQFSQVVAYGHQHGKEPDARFKDIISAHQLQQKGAITLSDALSQTNGISFLKTGPSIAKPIINGMHSNRLLVINGETKQEGQQWGTEHAPEIDPLSSGKIEVIKGASTLLYGGDGVGGVVLLLPESFTDTSYQNIELIAKGETNNSSGLIGLKIENYSEKRQLGNRLVLNIKRTGDSRSPNYVLSNTGFSQLSGSYYAEKALDKSTLQYSLSGYRQQIGILQASHIGNLTDLQRALGSDTPLLISPFTFEINRPYQLVQHYASKLKWIKEFENQVSLEANYTFQHNHRQEFDNHNFSDNASLDLRLQTHQGYALFTKHFNELKWQNGATSELQENVFKGRYFIPNYRRLKAGLFSLITLEKDKYLLEAGLRYDLQNTQTFRYVGTDLTIERFSFEGASATLSGWKKMGEDFQLHLAASSKMRAPDINELFSNGLHHGAASLEFGDLNLEQERSYSLSSAMHYNHNRLRIIFEPYYHYFNNYIYLKPSGETQLTIRGAFPVFTYVQTNAQYTGIDATINYWLSSTWNISASASLVYAKDVLNDRFIYGIPAQQTRGKLQYTIAEGLGIKNGLFALKPSYTFQQNRVEPNEDFAETPDGYFLLDVELGGNYRDSPLYFTFAINNVLNKEYRDYMNRYRYFAAETGINIALVINYKF